MFPYITGHPADIIFELCRNEIGKYWPANSLKYGDQSSNIFMTELKKRGIVEADGKVNPKHFYDFISSAHQG